MKASEEMSDDKQETEVFEMASGDISIWVDGGIHLKVNTPGRVPVELGEQEALKLGELLVRLANEQQRLTANSGRSKYRVTMTPERENEYNELLGYVGFFATIVWRIDPASPTHPANVIEGIVQQFGKSKALVGLRQAANDTIEETSNWNSEARAVADDGFRAAGVVTVSEIIRRYSTSYKRIVKRGFIKNETEYYVINAILVNQGSAISDGERACLQRLTGSI
ncbi:hypothetical protein LP419_38170 [Massilia sp. H-1]|nr:hypothetical protein LP419_38170 [Massilia sp. H-1]